LDTSYLDHKTEDEYVLSYTLTYDHPNDPETGEPWKLRKGFLATTNKHTARDHALGRYKRILSEQYAGCNYFIKVLRTERRRREHDETGWQPK